MRLRLLCFALGLGAWVACHTTAPVPAPPAKDPSAAWERALTEVVNADGSVDFDRLAERRPALQAWIGWLASRPRPQRLRENMAYWLNVYTALALEDVLLAARPVERLDPLGDPRAGRFGYVGGRAWRIGPRSITLFEVAHERVREHSSDPRVHAALPGLVRSSAPLAQRVWTTQTLEAQLDEQLRALVASPTRGVRVEADGVHLSAALTRWERDLRWWLGGRDLCSWLADYAEAPLADALQAAAGRGCVHHTLPWDATLDHRPYDGGHAQPALQEAGPRDTGAPR